MIEQPGTILRRLRRDRHLSLGQMAYLSNYAKNTLSQWETGKRPIPLHIYIGLLEIVGAKLKVVIESERGDRT